MRWLIPFFTVALLAPAQLWPAIWKVRDEGVLGNFLRNPRLTPERLVNLIQAPLSRWHAESLSASRWLEVVPVALQVLQAMDQTLQGPDKLLVLGQAAPWIKALNPSERLEAASRLSHPALRRMVRAWARPFDEEAGG